MKLSLTFQLVVVGVFFLGILEEWIRDVRMKSADKQNDADFFKRGGTHQPDATT